MAMIITDDQNYKDIAEAIREKNGEEIRYLPSEMADAIDALNSLNFQIIRGTTQPENPEENTIWVNTNHEIAGWFFSTNEPADPSEGMLWINTTNSDISFNALDENVLEVPIYDINQYISGKWVGISGCEIYLNGEWTEIISGSLYRNGNEFTAITGGWTTGHNGSNSFTGKKTANALSLVGSYSSGNEASWGGFATMLKIDVSKYRTLHAYVTVTDDLQSSRFGIGNSASGVAAGTSTISNSTKDAVAPGNYIYTIDVSTITSAVHVGFAIGVGAHNNKYGAATVSRIWMER